MFVWTEKCLGFATGRLSGGLVRGGDLCVGRGLAQEGVCPGLQWRAFPECLVRRQLSAWAGKRQESWAEGLPRKGIVRGTLMSVVVQNFSEMGQSAAEF